MLLNYQHCNMWVLIPFFLSALSAYGLKEYVPFQEIPQNEKNILFELVKRLGKGNDLDELVKRKSNDQWQSESAQSSQCAVTTNKTSIIRKNDSLLNGAQFLTSVKNVKSNDACWQLCCKNQTCDVSVFEDKDDQYCYLFVCEGKCKFGHHASYISNFIEHSDESAMGSVADGSELDLMGIESLKVSKTTYYPTPAPVAEKTTASAVYIRAHSVGLDGLLCREDQHCEDPNAVCSANKCRCKDGYYNKRPICRKVCPPSNFECVGIGTLGLGPQCLARDLVCDSVTQCADGSDEFNCPAVEADDQGTKGRKHHNKASKQPTEPDPVISLIGDHPRYSFSDSESHKSEASRPSSVADSFLSGGKGREGLDTSEEDNGKPLKPMFEGGMAEVHSNSVSAGDDKPSNTVKINPAGEATEKPEVVSTSSPSEGKSTEGARGEGTKSSVPVILSENDANSSSVGVGGQDAVSGSLGSKDAGSGSVGSKDAGSGSVGNKESGSGSTKSGNPDLVVQHKEVVMEHLDLSSVEGPSMQGPIIALSLGLAFTVVLLVFVACRLRNVRRRLRKGRPLHSNEADYLINGMYL